jgi:hypothetical protein
MCSGFALTAPPERRAASLLGPSLMKFLLQAAISRAGGGSPASGVTAPFSPDGLCHVQIRRPVLGSGDQMQISRSRRWTGIGSALRGGATASRDTGRDPRRIFVSLFIAHLLRPLRSTEHERQAGALGSRGASHAAPRPRMLILNGGARATEVAGVAEAATAHVSFVGCEVADGAAPRWLLAISSPPLGLSSRKQSVAGLILEACKSTVTTISELPCIGTRTSFSRPFCRRVPQR